MYNSDSSRDSRRRPQNSSGPPQNASLEENDTHASHLSSKVNELREISLLIGDEVRSQTSELDDMQSVFAQTTEYLEKTVCAFFYF
jgi:hypothetical protein